MDDIKLCEYCGKDVGAVLRRLKGKKKYCGRNCQHYAYMYRLKYGYGSKRIDEFLKFGKFLP